jgi:hypothetical protein
MTCASAFSVTSRGKLVTFPAQSRKLAEAVNGSVIDLHPAQHHFHSHV